MTNKLRETTNRETVMTQPLTLPPCAQAHLAGGTVALVGAGSGDPGLLTLRAWSLLHQADAVVYDRLVGDDLLRALPTTCQRHYVGKTCGRHVLSQGQINELLATLACRGLRVVRLKGGDPFVFGRGGEELDHLLARGIDCQVVPGVTAASACTAYAGIPLTHRGLAQSCTFITGHLQADGQLNLPWQALAVPGQTLVFYMGLGNLAEIAGRLQEAGLAPDTPAALVENGTLAEQRVIRSRLADLPDTARRAELQTPTLTVVGEVTRLFGHHRLMAPGQFQGAHPLAVQEAV